MDMSSLERAIEDGHLRIEKSGRTEKILYTAVNHSERWADPEEKVRAGFYAELILSLSQILAQGADASD